MTSRSCAFGAGIRRPFFLIAIAALAVSGCYSSDYARSLHANATLLDDLASKLADYTRANFQLGDRQVSSEEMGEFYYAFKKANSFASMEERSVPAQRESFQKFRHLLDDYRALVEDADQYRLSGKRDPTRIEAIIAKAASVHQDVHELIAVLDVEAR